MTMLADTIIAVIRTLVPSLVGGALAWAASRGVEFDEGLGQTAAAALVATCTTLYYFLVTVLERHVWSGFGWLLGYAKPPAYGATEE